MPFPHTQSECRRPRCFARWGLTAILASVIAVIVPPAPTAAHTPHDVVTAIVFAPSDEGEPVGFAIVRGLLMRSSDDGQNWSEIVQGLPGDADPVVAIAVAQSSPQTAYLATASGRLFVSDDSGLRWHGVGSDLPRAGLEVAPTDSSHVVAFGPRSGVSVSIDRGDTWIRGQGFGRGLTHAAFVDNDTLLGANASGGLFRSVDGGVTWLPLEGPGFSGSISALHAHRNSPRLILAGSDRGELSTSTDGGETFEMVATSPAPDDPVRSIHIPDGSDGREWWVTNGKQGPSRSPDGGQTWALHDVGLWSEPQAESWGVEQWNAVVPTPGDSGRVLLAGFSGVFVAEVPVFEWRPVETLGDYLSGLAISPNYANDATVIASTYVRGAFKSTNGGETWNPANGGLKSDKDERRLVPVWRLHDVEFSPSFGRDRTVFSATWERILRSTDGGQNWEHIRLPDSPDGRDVRQFVITAAPNSSGGVSVVAGTRQGVLYLSTSGGASGTWETVSTLDSPIRSIVIAGDSWESSIILVGTGEAVSRSIDQGQTWHSTARSATPSPVGGAFQVAASPAFAADGTAFAVGGHALLQSTDHGTTWAPVALGVDAGVLEAVAVSPHFESDGIVLVSSRGVGLLRSTNGGATFSSVGEGLLANQLVVADNPNPTATPIQFSPAFAEDQTVLALARHTVIKSTDGGLSWQALTLPDTGKVLSSLSEDHWLRRSAVVRILIAGIVVVGTMFTLVRRRRIPPGQPIA